MGVLAGIESKTMNRHGKLLARLVFYLTVLVLTVDPVQAANVSEPEDLSSLLAEAPAATGMEGQKSDKLWGIKFEGELRANLWYQYADQYQWKTTNRLDMKAEKQIEALKLLAPSKSGLSESRAGAGHPGRSPRGLRPVPLEIGLVRLPGLHRREKNLYIGARATR